MKRIWQIAWLVFLLGVLISFSGCASEQGESIGVASETPSQKEGAPSTPTISPIPQAISTLLISTPTLVEVEPTSTKEIAEVLPTKDPRSIKITIVFDNYPFDDRLSIGWGFAALIENRGYSILFDTGGLGDVFMENIHTLNIDPKVVDAVVISHSHGDHIAGLLPFLEEANTPKVYLLTSFPSGLMKKVSMNSQVVEVAQSQEIVAGIYSTGALHTVGISEQALVIDRGDDIVVITGCAHPGIVNIVRKAKTVVQVNKDEGDKPVALVVGGFHLIEASRAEIEGIIDNLQALGVQRVSPTHCTGDGAITMFQEYFGEGYIPAGVGKIITLQ